MRIVLDMQGAQTESRFRGIGRYTIELAKALVANAQGHEIVLVLNADLPEGEAQVRREFEGLLPERQILTWRSLSGDKGPAPAQSPVAPVAELLREAFLASLKPDLIHISSFVEGWVDAAVTSLGRFDQDTPVSVTLHDLIPLINADHYLTQNPPYEQHYRSKIEQMSSASMMLAVSDSSRQEAIDHLKYPHDRIFNASEGVDALFRPVEATQSQHQRLQDWGILGGFVLYTGGSDERKNLPLLVTAWAAMAQSFRNGYQMVFAGRMSTGEVQHLRHVAHQNGLDEDELIFTGYISDEELVALYNLCSLFVFPSWHEGFGLPVLEAMACGAPVLAANTTSLPEVLGLEQASFSPRVGWEITDLMTRALDDPQWCQQLRQHGLRQAQRFSWTKTAQKALKFWAQQTTVAPKQDWPTWSDWATQHSKRLKAAIALELQNGPRTATQDQLSDIAKSIHHNELVARNFHRPLALPSQLTWRLEGPFDSSYSLALLNRELAKGLQTIGHQVVLHSTEGPGDFEPNATFLQANSDLAAMHNRAPLTSAQEAHVCSRNLYPPRSSGMHAPWNIMHAYGWEESNFPHEWAQDFNDNLQGLTVMSEHCRKVLIDSGVSIPIEVSGVGVDHWDRIQAKPEAPLQARTFRFLHVSSCFPRKGADAMLEAYGRAFSGKDDVSLVIKTFPNPHNDIHEWLSEARAKHNDFPHVVVIEEDLEDASLKALYQQCHALVAPSRAEGFGLPMAEAMLSGLAVLTTGWSGQTDFCNEETAWLIDYDFERAQTHFGLYSSVWANPRTEHMAERMREIWQLPVEHRQIKAQAGRQLLMQRFKWTDVAQRNEQALRQLPSKLFAQSPRIAWISTWNSRCGIAAYSQHLLLPMDGKIHIHAQHTANTVQADGPNVTRCWHMDGQDKLHQLSQSLQQQDAQIVVIQFNYGFFNFAHLDRFIHEQIQQGRQLVISMHATVDPEHVPDKKLGTLISALSKVARVIVHTINDLNRLKRMGLERNVTLIPLGILDHIPAAIAPAGPQQPVRLASYGFFLPHKGFPELIDAVAILRSQGHNVELDMVNAEYADPISTQAIEQAKQQIEKLGMTASIRLHTDYLTDAQSFEKLAPAQLILFPYQNTGESASAAVRFGIASGRDVAVTPLEIFRDVQAIAHRLPGCSPQEMANGIQDWMQAQSQGLPQLQAMRERAQQWRQQHRYSQLAQRWQGMLAGLFQQRHEPV